MKIKLNKKQFDYLEDCLSNEQANLKSRIQIKKEHHFFIIELDDETADDIRDWAIEELVRIGFDINYELTPIGQILEQLIDVLYIK